MMSDTETAIAYLRAHGLRVTPQRRAVIEALVGNTSHPLAEDVAQTVAERMPGVSLSTVYKTLNEFAAIGLVQRLEGSGAMRFDPDVSEHAHLSCSACGRVVDVPIDAEVAQQLRQAAGETGADVARVTVELTGTCTDCATKH